MSSSQPLSTGKPAAESFWAGLLLLALASVGLAAYTPFLGLVGDDWSFFANLSDGEFVAHALYVDSARPIVAYGWGALWPLFGLNLPAYYLMSAAAYWCSAMLLFLLLRNVLSWPLAGATACAAVFLLYPADTAHVYLAALMTRLSLTMALAGALLWLRAGMRPSASRLWAAAGLGMMGMSLLTYETPLLLLAAVPLIAAGRARREPGRWVRRAIPLYGLLGAYTLFRLWIAYTVAQRPDKFHVALDFSPGWLLAQILSLVSAVTWKGWLYTLKSMLDLGIVASAALLIGSMAVLMPALTRLQDLGQDAGGVAPGNWRDSMRAVAAGVSLAMLGALPVVVSTMSLENAVGTLDGRLLHATGIGHAVAWTGLCSLLLFALPILSARIRRVIWSATAAAFLSLALISSLGVQRDYARSWQAQLDILRGLQTRMPAVQDGTSILLLDVPSGASDIRFYYPYTQLARRYYDNMSLHVLPWTAGFPAGEQTVVLGQDGVAVITDITQGHVERFGYEDMVGFQVNPGSNLAVVREVGLHYLLADNAQAAYVSLPDSWRPVRGTLILNDPATRTSEEEPPRTRWRQWLAGQIAWRAQCRLCEFLVGR